MSYTATIRDMELQGSVTFLPTDTSREQPVVLENTGNVKDVTVRLEPGLPEYTLGDPSSLDLADYERPQVQIQAIEVTQGTQDWNNSVQLVGGRATAVRVFFTTSDTREVEVTARLRGVRHNVYANGSAVARELDEQQLPLLSRKGQAAETGGSVVVYAALDGKGKPLAAQQVEHACEADTAAARSRCRADVDASLNFVLPDDWTWAVPNPLFVPNLTITRTTMPPPVPPALTASSLSLQLAGFPSHVQVVCSEAFTALAKASCPGGTPTVQVSFTDVNAPKVVLAGVTLKSTTGGADTTANPRPCLDGQGALTGNCGYLREQYERLFATLPLPTAGEERAFSAANVVDVAAFNCELENRGNAAAARQAAAAGEQTPQAIVQQCGDAKVGGGNDGLLKKLADAVAAKRRKAGHSNKEYLYGAVLDYEVPDPVVPGGVFAGQGGGSNGEIPKDSYDNPVWYTHYVGYGQPSKRMNLGAHELGHAMGQYHPRPAGGGQFCGESGGRDYPASHTVSYGQLGLAQLASFKIIYPDIQVADSYHSGAFLFRFLKLDGNTQRALPLLGPLTSRAAEVWGLDLRYLTARAATGTLQTDQDQLVASNPRHVYSLLSYCTPSIRKDAEGNEHLFGGFQAGWLDSHYHAQLIHYMNHKVN